MALWTQNVWQRLTDAQSAEDAFAQIALGARELGFEYCAYGLRLPLSFTNPKTLILSSYERRWSERYLEAGYLRTDPTVAHGTRSAQPVVWSNKLFQRAPQMWDEARSFGLRVGWAQSCLDPDGRIGMLTLARSNDRLTRSELLAHDPLMRWLVNMAHLTLAGHLGGAQASLHEPLTRRQVEVLRWTADGKTSEEIALILSISANTVNFHIKNAVVRLRVANKSAAVARSSKLGLLD
ncbi:autoinducer binding domain-containing protein [Variovorax paradoxus]|nr:autoinducer binding domain-containing protein [Variovorax paradoxus]MBT2305035.1 autoinducer binding domain-containing protein [Variovorax paradoxus]